MMNNMILFFVGVFIILGGWIIFSLKKCVSWRLSIYRKLRFIFENKSRAPIKKNQLMLERSLCRALLIIGVALIWPQLAWCVNERNFKEAHSSVSSIEELIALTKECPAEVGYYGKNFKTGKIVEYRPGQPACLASIVKLFVLLEVIRQHDLGQLDLSESVIIERNGKKETCTISQALDKMIGVSDNEATGVLAAMVGYDRVNSLASELGINGLSDKILPDPGVLPKILDKRVFYKRFLPEMDLLPQHGTAKAIVRYFELLHEKKLINEKVSSSVLEVLERNPKPSAPARPVIFFSVGKGGSIIWKRPFFRQYNMVGWGLYLHGHSEAAAFCLWAEWFPERMKDEQKQKWIDAILNSIVRILLGDSESQVPLGPVPDFASAVALVKMEVGLDAWDKLLKDPDTKRFVATVELGKISQTTTLGTKITPLVVCQDVPTRAHFTWRWRNPEGLYKASEVEFGQGALWGWLPMVSLDQEGLWHFEIGYNKNKIFEQSVLVQNK
jgi:hypothetical protein